MGLAEEAAGKRKLGFRSVAWDDNHNFHLTHLGKLRHRDRSEREELVQLAREHRRRLLQ